MAGDFACHGFGPFRIGFQGLDPRWQQLFFVLSSGHQGVVSDEKGFTGVCHDCGILRL
ncbi:hypothetical protein [Microvirga sp. Mcv34]|uniref:hypothetical protein n=1 Tax=Microvirga sp. Mcv34 TaxID=2926016 RepID=UPI0021CAA15E|nr:hypothetical protein [Microvirga sp. Mcv34]